MPELLKDGPFRLHVVSLPWTNTNGQHSTCAYTAKVEKFGKMMTRRGHEVFIYSGPDNTAECTEHIQAITPDEQAGILGTTNAPWNTDHPAWVAMNTRAAVEIAKRAPAGSKDLLLLISGAQKPIADALPWLTNCEFGIGYSGTFSANRVFESETWRHTVYGKEWGTDYDGPPWHTKYDCVIPNYFDSDDFEVGHPGYKDPYFLYIGRGIWRKGTQIAADVCEHIGARLLFVGDTVEGWPEYGEKMATVGPQMRRDLLANAVAVFVPTQYGEPFGGVAVEAMLSGTPVITSDYGAFVETVRTSRDPYESDGWRCRTMAEYTDAARYASRDTFLPTWTIPLPNPHTMRKLRRDRAIARFSLEAVAPAYERFFGQLTELWGASFGTMEHPVRE